IDVDEGASSNEVRLATAELFRDAGPYLQRTGQPLSLHDPFHRECGRDLQWHAGVVSFSMTRRAGHNRIVISDTGFLRSLRYVIDVGPKRNHRLTRTPSRHPAGRHRSDAPLD